MSVAVGSVGSAFEQFGGEIRIGEHRAPEATNADASEGPSFASVLEKTVMSASNQENAAVHKAEALANGKTDDLHGTMIAMKEADISLKLVGNVRNKLLDAFHELWRTSV